MAKFDPKTKKEKKQEQQVQVQLVPFERYVYEGMAVISKALEKMQRDLDIIKERITFEKSEDN